jgi:hydroxymethylglutaryl-CoA lyase
MSNYIYINDVGPRDGLQNQTTVLNPETRIELIQRLIASGLPGIEICSFVNPKAVPAMSGAHDIVQAFRHTKNCDLSVLVPNLKGYELARGAGAKTVTVVPSATETMNQKNINMSLAETIESVKEILKTAVNDKLNTRAYISVAWECPYEGKVDSEIIISIAEQLLEAGASELILADTIGATNPRDVSELFKKITRFVDTSILSAHFHDTRALGLANVVAAMNEGITKFDACIGGLGGCPFAPGAAGNLATEDLCSMLHQMGYETNIDLIKLLDAVAFVSSELKKEVGGRMTPWFKKNLQIA